MGYQFGRSTIMRTRVSERPTRRPLIRILRNSEIIFQHQFQLLALNGLSMAGLLHLSMMVLRKVRP